MWNKKPQEIPAFEMLSYLEVCNINSLKYLLITPSMASNFKQLLELKIINCIAMEQVITEECLQEILFPRLGVLFLMNLPKLTRFCSGNSLRLPRLGYLTISRCPLMTSFISDSVLGDVIASSQEAEETSIPALFDAKVTSSSPPLLLFNNQ